MLVSRLRLDELSRLEVDVIVALARPIDAIGPMEAGVEPLRRIGRGHLSREHEPHFVEIGARVLLAVEEPCLPAPIGPGAGEPVEHLFGRDLGAEALALRQRAERGLVGNRAPQERGNALLLDPLQARRHASFAEIFLRQHVGRDLAPGGRNLDAFERKHDRAVRIADFAPGRREGDELIGRDARLRIMPFDPHRSSPLHRASHRAAPPCSERGVQARVPMNSFIGRPQAPDRARRLFRAQNRKLGSPAAVQDDPPPRTLEHYAFVTSAVNT